MVKPPILSSKLTLKILSQAKFDKIRQFKFPFSEDCSIDLENAEILKFRLY